MFELAFNSKQCYTVINILDQVFEGGVALDIQDFFESLIELEPYEQLGRAYFLEKGRSIDYFSIEYYLKHFKNEEPYHFEILDTPEAKGAREHFLQVFSHKYLYTLSEQKYMPKQDNVELQHLLRYVDIVEHKHDFFEVVCVLSGSCTHSIDGQPFELSKGDITVIPPDCSHHLEALQDCVVITIKLRKSTFDMSFSSLLQTDSLLSEYFAWTLYTSHFHNSLTFHCGDDVFLFQQVLYMFHQQKQGLPYAGRIIEGLLNALFAYILQNYEGTSSLTVPGTTSARRVLEIESYIRQNYKTATLAGTARHFYLSEPYLSSFIHKHSGYTFSQLVRRCRMRRAAELLTSTRLNLDGICEAVGYQDTTQFVRSFKKSFGITPGAYRNKKDNLT